MMCCPIPELTRQPLPLLSLLVLPLLLLLLLQGSSVARDMRSSIHRCLVFLGDLSRYASQAAPKAATIVAAPTAAGSSGSAAAATAAKAEWSKAVSYYRMAAHVLPRSGNPHNQLAVMAFMTGEELKAAYHYARSLCVHVPFMTARENLLQLLQSNRDR
jgi:protein SMG7